jgi:hypothetical protein
MVRDALLGRDSVAGGLDCADDRGLVDARWVIRHRGAFGGEVHARFDHAVGS